jgi:small subunit ribosomal protein S4
MARNLKPRSKISRRIGEKLHLKGERDLSAKHAYTRRNYPPGVHGPKGYGRATEYGVQMREKQKMKALFGVLERQFSRYIQEALTYKGVTGNKLLELIERRLDNAIFRLHLATSRTQARQFVSHGHVCVNGRRVTIPSYQVKAGDEISLREKSKTMLLIKERVAAINSMHLAPPAWMAFDYDVLRGKVARTPDVGECEQGIDTRLIVEFYSR